ncbi:MAG: hypothetical protein EP344_03930, partial [Bacteroidetes bacterium]
MMNRSALRMPLLGLILFCASLLSGQTTVKINGPDLVCPGCYSYSPQFFPNQQPSITYQWQVISNFGNFFTSSDAQLYYCFQEPGTYEIIFTAADVNGTALTDTLTVLVLPYIAFDIVSDNAVLCGLDSLNNPDIQYCDKVCPYSTVTYSIQPDPFLSGGLSTSATIYWNITGAQSYTLNPPFHTSVTVNWGPSGVGAVSAVLTAGNPGTNNCTGEDALCVTIVDEPRAAFTSDPAPGAADTIRVCKDQTVYFENTSQHADSYEWFFGDDLSATGVIDPQHTYVTPGYYTVRLIARSACFCVDTTEMIVQVLDAEAPTLECTGDVCPGTTVTYRASANCTGINWSVSANGTVLNGGYPGADSISVEWGDGPVGLITLDNFTCAGFACPAPTKVRIPIIDDNAEIRGAERVCPDAEEVYSIDPYGGTGFVWSLSGGGTIIDGFGTNRVSIRWNSFPNPNTVYWLSVRYDNCYLGCGGVDSIPVRIVSSVYINGPVEACQNSSENFLSRLSYNNLNLDCNWTLLGPDGSSVWTSAAPAASVNVPFSNGPGIYRLFAVPDDPAQSCTDEAEWAIQVPDLPAGPAGIDGAALICPGEAFPYSAAGTLPGNAVQWTIVNGPAAPEVRKGNPVLVQWSALGPYQLTAVQLSSDGLGCASDPVVLNLQVLNTVVVNGPPSVCAGNKRTYTAPLIPGLDYQWSLVPASAGTIAAGQGTNQVEVYWQTPGNHQLQLDLCGQSATRAVTVHALPDPAVVHPGSLCPGATATIQTSTPYAAYNWAAAAGGTLGVLPAIDLGPGDYVVSITDANGCPGNTSFSIGEAPAPQLTVSTADPTAFCANSETVTMRALVNTGGVLTYEWFRDGMPLGVNAPVYSTNQYGLYTVQATNASGCTALAGPVAVVEDCAGGGGFPCTPRPPCPPGSVNLQIDPSARCDSLYFTLSGPDFLAGSGSWAFVQSGASSIGVVVGDETGFVFPEPGYYVVAGYAELTDGTLCRIIDSLTVEAVAAFTVLPECPGLATGFEENSAFLPTSGITNWAWDFGDPASGANNSSAIRTPGHIYDPGGGYMVTLTITANSGCTSAATAMAQIPQVVPPMIIPPATSCAGNALEFVASGSNLSWDFGNPASGVLNTTDGSPVYHSFPDGNYNVTATLEDNYGCTASAGIAVTISPNTLSGMITPSSPAPLCEGATVVLTAPGGVVNYEWSDGSTADTLLISEEGIYSVTLTDGNGCVYVPPPVPVSVLPGPDALIKALLTNEIGQVIGVAYPVHTVCAGDDVRLQVFGQGSYAYAWSSGGLGASAVFSEDRHNQLSVGTYVFTVTVTDNQTGCTASTDPFTVTVNPVPSGFSISQDNFPACAGSTNTLNYTGPTPGNWQYIWNTGQTDLPLVTDQPGLYFLRVINEFGCEERSNKLTVFPGPNTLAIPAGCHTRCKPDTLCLPVIPNIASWQWYFNGSPIPGANSPNLVAQQSGTYYAELTDWFGCTSESGPLSVNLLDGYGNILGQIWSDVNNNGLIDGPDTLVSGITVDLLQNSVPIGSVLSNLTGDFAFTNILSENYQVEINAGMLPAGWDIVIGLQGAGLSGCDAETQVGLLLRPVCITVFTSTVELTACPGSVANYQGTPVPAGSSQVFNLVTSEGCDSIVTVNVGMLAVSSGTLDVSACPGTFYDYNGTLIPAGSTEQFLLQNYLGCDSVLTVNVSSLAVSSGTLEVSACPGTFYDYNGTLIAAGSTQQFL